MPTDAPETNARSAKPRTTAAVGRWSFAFGLLSLLPLVWQRNTFGELFWFGDEWDQLDQISRQGFWHWVLSCFGENFAPLLKVLWGGLALGSHGSYTFMITAVWCVHAMTVGLLARWMLETGVSVIATAVVAAAFGLAATNIETLGWTIQLITIQGMALFLVAAHWQDARDRDGRWSAATLLVLFLLVALSTFSFVRGALTGTALAATALCPWLARTGHAPRWPTRLLIAGLCLLPAVASVAVIMKFAPGNHQHLGAVGWKAPTLFGLSYYLLNPFYKFVADGMWSTSGLVGFGAFKIAILLLGWRRATASQRRMLLPLLLFDLGNAVLMGIGRYNEPLITATSSRYQYVALITALPFLAIVLDGILDPLRRLPGVRGAVAAILIAVVVSLAASPWPRELAIWAEYRGRNTRELLFRNPHPPAEHAIPGIPFLTTARAKELVDEYHLH